MQVRKMHRNLCLNLLILPDSSGWLDNPLFYIYFRIKSFTRQHSHGSYMKFDLQCGIVKTIFNLFQSTKFVFLFKVC